MVNIRRRNKVKMVTKQERESAKQEIKMYMANDWTLAEETPEYFLLTRNEATGTGHLLVFLLTFWFTLGIGNLIYHFASNAKKKIIK